MEKMFLKNSNNCRWIANPTELGEDYYPKSYVRYPNSTTEYGNISQTFSLTLIKIDGQWVQESEPTSTESKPINYTVPVANQ